MGVSSENRILAILDDLEKFSPQYKILIFNKIHSTRNIPARSNCRLKTFYIKPRNSAGVIWGHYASFENISPDIPKNTGMNT